MQSGHQRPSQGAPHVLGFSKSMLILFDFGFVENVKHREFTNGFIAEGCRSPPGPSAPDVHLLAH
jgi:hypothetical protein